MKPPATTGNLSTITTLLTELTRAFFRFGHGQMQAGPQKTRMAGLPALRFQGTATEAGTPLKVTFVYAFRGVINYWVACMNTPAKAAEVGPACQEVMQTFQIGKAAVSMS